MHTRRATRFAGIRVCRIDLPGITPVRPIGSERQQRHLDRHLRVARLWRLYMTLLRRTGSVAIRISRDAVSDAAEPADDRAEDNLSRRQLDAIYRAQAPGLARYFRARFRGAEDPQDLVQEVFTRFAGGRPISELHDPEAYLKRILRNFLITRKKRLDNRPSFVSLDGVDPAVQPDQAHAIELTQMHARYRACVDALPPRTREVFLLHRAAELSVKTIAERLGISSRTVEWHIAQAILRLGEALERE